MPTLYFVPVIVPVKVSFSGLSKNFFTKIMLWLAARLAILLKLMFEVSTLTLAKEMFL